MKKKLYKAVNAYKLNNIAFFNDGIRDGLRGNPFSHEVRGFLSGEYNKEYDVKRGIVEELSIRIIFNLGEMYPLIK